MLRRLAPASLLALLACSSSAAGSGASPAGPAGGTIPQAFSTYCTGTLQTTQPVYAQGPSGSWIQQGDQTAAAGASFLIEADLGSWDGFVFASDGTPSKIEPENGMLVAGQDFTSDCPTAMVPPQTSTVMVLLADATFYPSASLTGTACTLRAGTAITNEMFTINAQYVAQLSSPEVSSKCGASPMYTNHIAFGQLVAK
jgi:hypothetical protein